MGVRERLSFLLSVGLSPRLRWVMVVWCGVVWCGALLPLLLLLLLLLLLPRGAK